MLLYSHDPDGFTLARILDTDAGLVYDLTFGWPIGLTKEEAQDKLFSVVQVFSVHNHSEAIYPIRYEREAADDLWAFLSDEAIHMPSSGK